MTLPAHYATGTVTVTADSRSVTGAGTQWLAAGARPGDLFVARGLTASIASIQSATALTLTQPWPGSTVTGTPYEIRYVADASRVLATATAALSAMPDSTDVDFAAQYATARDTA